IRHRKNNTLRLLPGGPALARAYRYLGRVMAPAPRHSKLKTNTKPTAGMFKKLFAVGLVGAVVVSCSCVF
ncbi:hypothetical protein ACVGXO_06630, partial [Enterobacter hormaechei]